MESGKTGKTEAQKDLSQYRDAFKLSADYVKPEWDKFLRLYKLWRGIKPKELDATISGIWINLFHSLVQDRMPEIFNNIFAGPKYLTLESDHPRYDLSVEPAQKWLRNLLDDRIKIRSDAVPTLQSTLIGGTGFRMPFATYQKRDGQWVPIISSRDVDFFNVLPSPNGGLINPCDEHRDDAIDWAFVVDWWTDEKLNAMKGKKGYNEDELAKLMDGEYTPGGNEEEDAYRNEFKQVNGLTYESYGSQRDKVRNLPEGAVKRRVVHWFRRDKHIIVAEDRFVIYKGDLPMGDGIIPLCKYAVTPDLKNFYGIGQLEMAEDLIMAMVMNFNYRMDHLLGVMFPTAWIRDDIRKGKSEDDFIPRPYSVNFFPTAVQDIQRAIFYDRRPEVSSQAFIEEDRMKALLQKVAGAPETTGSMKDVVGNRTATGVTSILSKLAGRPNMEAAIIEEMGLREEATLLLKLGDIHVNRPQWVPTPATGGGTAWTEISPYDITDKFTVRMNGSRFMADQNMQFQKLMALYPMWNNNPAWDQYELNRQVAEVADVLPNPEKALIPPAPQLGISPDRPSAAMPTAPGGIASPMDMGQAARSTRERTTVQAVSGKQVRAF